MKIVYLRTTNGSCPIFYRLGSRVYSPWRNYLAILAQDKADVKQALESGDFEQVADPPAGLVDWAEKGYAAEKGAKS